MMRHLFSPIKVHFSNVRAYKVFSLRSSGLICNRANNQIELCYSGTINSTTSSLNVNRYNHVVNVREELQTTSKSTADSEFLAITNGDPIIENKLKILILEAEIFRQSGVRVPDHIRLEQWKELLELPTRSKRKKYLAYIFGVEKRKESKKLKKEESKKQKEESYICPKKEEDGHIQYGLGNNSMFLRVYDATITKFHNSRLFQAMLFGQKLVLDCAYDTYMNKHEAQNCSKQLMLLFSDNRLHDNPFDLHFCNVNKESIAMKTLAKYIPTLYDPDFPLNLTEKSYLDIFPKENLIYLTPHCREVIKEFDHDAVYIIGAMVDKVNNESLSLAKAKREGLRMAKLPLDEYLLWGSGGSKCLTLNQMIRILLDIRQSNDWNKALLHVPQRKLTQPSNKQINRKHTKSRIYNFKI
ncbi:hypothetical protein L9F63_017469 [Diploptera punctata]|uniref:RNA (guanine-9-)-methyltransferase domain-containing protein 1 n=1 Tax=Diploptera punctata TaxID=6984 RepID=A0AAD7ZYM9_DIPPU|nr:hypothetical protein L9F63_017469 [Diploptera punctata]